jgi:hypothetical protein
MNSIYHILDKIPAIYQDDIQIEYERLAEELVDSGKLRIDTDYYCNFVHFNSPQDRINIVLSYDELNNPDLLESSRETIKNLYRASHKEISEQQVNSILNNLNDQIKKNLMVSKDLALRLARILVQAAHPIVINWILLDKTEVFITYSHNIGDVMDIKTWKRAGTNSGMQSTDGRKACVYVSCGGDPFAENNKDFPTQGDGWPALARLQIIAGQEIGHYSDIKRDYQGNQVTRHSANFACTRATPHVKKGRRNDITRCKELLHTLMKEASMEQLVNIETQLKFYDKQKLSGPRVWWLKMLTKIYRQKLINFADKRELHFIKRFNRDRYMGLMIAAMIEDMQTQLSPGADVYKRDDPEAEEAISCVEALARVPQQVMKWGYLTTKATMHDLYEVYYGEVIPSLIDSYNHLTKTTYHRNYAVPRLSLLSKIRKIIPFIGEKKVKFTEVRELE